MAIIQPRQNQVIAPGTDIFLFGVALDSDPETRRPPRVESVTYQIDGGPDQPLAHVVTVFGFATHVTYGQDIGALPDGEHVISVTVQFSLDTVPAAVTITVGAPPTIAKFNAMCIAKSAFTLASLEAIELAFSGSSVVIQSFPQITFPTASFAGASLDVIMSLNNPGPGGNFDNATGVITIPDVVLDINATISISVPIIGTITRSASGTLTTTLTTEQTTSAEAPPVFTDDGRRLQAGGQILLVGDGIYSSPIFGMTDGGIALAGIIAPHP